MRIRQMIPSLLLMLSIAAVAQQDYYKIQFKKAGMYKITGEELAQAGAIISQIQPEKLQLFSDGQRTLPVSTTEPQPQLQEVAIIVDDGGDNVFDPQDFLLFYGQSLNRFEWDAGIPDYAYLSNPYDTLAGYWLRWNVENGKRIAVKDGTPVTPSAAVRNTFDDYLHLEKDRFNRFKSGLVWTWNLFGEENTFSHAFSLSGVAGGEAAFTAQMRRFRFYFEVGNARAEIVFSLNNTSFPPFTISGDRLVSGMLPVQEGVNNLTVEYTPEAPEDSIRQHGLDWVELRYPRHTYLIGDELAILTGLDNGIFKFQYRGGGDSDPIQIYDVSDPFNPAQILTNNDSLFEDALFSTHPNRYFLVRDQFARSAVRIEAAQRGLFSAADGADYIIIAHREMEASVLPLKSHRETFNQFSVKLVNTGDIFDEFGFGRRDPTAIRNFIRFAYDNWNPRPQFVLLAGNGYYDYRNISGDFPVNWVPAFEISANNDIDSRATDDYFVDVTFTTANDAPGRSENDFIPGLRNSRRENTGISDSPEVSGNFSRIRPQLAIGRFPADTPAELAAMVEKTIESETRFKPGLWRLNWLLIADDEFAGPSDNEYFFLSLTERNQKNDLPARARTFKLYETEYPFVNREKPTATRQLINWLNQGNRGIVFNGHSDERQWTHENLLNFSRDLSLVKNRYKTGFFFGMSLQYKFDAPQPGIAQELLKKEFSGFSSTLTANRPVFAFQSFDLIRSFWQHLFSDANGSLGKAVMMAKSGSTNDQKYHLLGDPAANIGLPEERIHITGISPDTLKARGLVQISGQVDQSAPGDSLILEIREPGRIKKNGGTFYETTGNAIFRGLVPVNNGQFSAQFVVPDDVPHDSIATRGKLYAYTWNGLNEGMGFVDSLAVGGFDGGVVDVTPPQISLSVTGIDSASGGDPYFIADIFDENGVNLSSLGNHFPVLFIDGNSLDSINVSDFFTYLPGSYQSGTLRYPLPFLSRGNHSLTLSVHDNYNNASRDSISFVVTGIKTPPEFVPNRISLAQNFPNPFNPSTDIRFSIEGSSRFQVRLEIYNILGQRVRVLLNRTVPPGEYQLTWDGRSEVGDRVASGIYIYRLWVSSHALSGTPNQRGSIFQQSRKMLLVK